MGSKIYGPGARRSLCLPFLCCCCWGWVSVTLMTAGCLTVVFITSCSLGSTTSSQPGTLLSLMASHRGDSLLHARLSSILSSIWNSKHEDTSAEQFTLFQSTASQTCNAIVLRDKKINYGVRLFFFIMKKLGIMGGLKLIGIFPFYIVSYNSYQNNLL